MVATNSSVLVRSSILTHASVRLDSNDMVLSAFNKQCTTSRVTVMAHNFIPESTIGFAVHSVDEHVVADLIDHISTSVENLTLVMGLVEVAILVDRARCTPTSKPECFTSNVSHSLCVPGCDIVHSLCGIGNLSIEEHDSNISGVRFAVPPALVGPDFFDTKNIRATVAVLDLN